MGNNTAIDLATNIDISLEQAIGYHLQGNHYPPVPLSMVKPCIEALDAAREMDAMRQIEMPEGVSYKGKTHAPAWAIIEQHHLDAWLPQDEADYWEEDAGYESGLGLE
ncbi:MAG: hypothetical protein ACK5BD_04560 [Chitinophagaceae bacterium]|jgi:hypothetical protein